MIDVAVVLVLLAGDVIATVGAAGPFDVIVAEADPNALVHTTTIELDPLTIGTEAVVTGAGEPLIVQVVPDGIVDVPLTVNETIIGVPVAVLPLEGEVITTIGAEPRLTVITACPVPNAPVQATVIVLAPVTKLTELVVVLVDATPLTVQVVPDGIVDVPLTV